MRKNKQLSMFQLGVLSSFIPYLLLSLFYVIGWFVYPNTKGNNLESKVVVNELSNSQSEYSSYSDFHLIDNLQKECKKDYYTFNYTINDNLLKYLPILNKCHRSLSASIIKEKEFYRSFYSRPPTRK